jgi:predicted HAD superfamily Cof-like phosphohydrolase
MKQEQEMVRQFHKKGGSLIKDYPELPDSKCGKLRLNLIGEEFVELANALGFYANFDPTDFCVESNWGDIVDVADALGDLLYVILGTAVSCGINIEPIFHEIHRSNMTKFIDGSFREDGKYVKGTSYERANLEPIIRSQF